VLCRCRPWSAHTIQAIAAASNVNKAARTKAFRTQYNACSHQCHMVSFMVEYSSMEWALKVCSYGLLQVLMALDVRSRFRGHNVAATVRFRLKLGVYNSPKAALNAEIIGVTSICLQDSKFLLCSRTCSCTLHFFTVAIADGACVIAPNLVEGRSCGLRTLQHGGGAARSREGRTAASFRAAAVRSMERASNGHNLVH
jgi:hypothetical protein